MTTLEQKKELRKRMLAIRASLTGEERAERSLRITDRLFSSGILEEGADVFAFWSVRGEVDTSPLIRRVLAGGGRVAFPKTSGGNMWFFYVNDLADLVPGNYGIPEPPERECADGDGEALIIMPGLAFTRTGNRLGYGASYYDRYLAEHPGHRTAAPAFDLQIVEELPADPWDLPIDAVITETEVFLR